ncbi:8-amino-7-oxononanoate synthase [Alteromonas sp. C1M14]|uniref:8-amino-7-oxononanoate synthase n=1 Tax=Alteromonas sp. C1M14 TaxID=2841567 RepID=UPI001C0994E7|nr:8-amino-7-oxononanoate synthase [Alteromonas sp. C1M14]MBU2977450.1 8-amino-7-oxononanoate synthase [Alteromonas sp. C1M14]
MAFDFISARVAEKSAAGYLRARTCVEYEKDGIICVDGAHYLNFASNDYLGMRQHEGVLQSWVEGLAQFGAGSGASPLVTGYTQAHAALEGYLESHLNRDAVLLFNSGFAANQAICQALLKDNTRVLADKYMHASFIDGALASQAPFRRFAHNDMSHLATLLEKGEGDCLVATEGVFSMDGDVPPVSELVSLCQTHNAWLMLDDAHGFGVLGENGLGTAELDGLSQHALPVLMGTFGKAVGTAGAFVAGSQAFINYLINEARHYIYSTAMPAAQAVATLYSLTAIAAGDERQKLFDNIALFRRLIKDSGLTVAASDSAIQPVLTDGPMQAMALSKALRERGIWVPAIRYPTVPKGTDRLRITLSASHNEQDIRALVDALQLARDTL